MPRLAAGHRLLGPPSAEKPPGSSSFFCRLDWGFLHSRVSPGSCRRDVIYASRAAELVSKQRLDFANQLGAVCTHGTAHGGRQMSNRVTVALKHVVSNRFRQIARSAAG